MNRQQCYKGVSLDDKSYVAGLSEKFLEHAYSDNDAIVLALSHLTPNKPWYRSRIIWSGDLEYPLGVHNPKTAYEVATNDFAPLTPLPSDGTWIENISERYLNRQKTAHALSDFRYLINYSKSVYVLLPNVPILGTRYLHPLPLLTVTKPYPKELMELSILDHSLLGSWCGDRIGLEQTLPSVEEFKIISPFKIK